MYISAYIDSKQVWRRGSLPDRHRSTRVSKKGAIVIAWLQDIIQLAIVNWRLSCQEKTPYLGTVLCTTNKKDFSFPCYC